MSAPKSEFLRILKERGFIHQATDLDGLDARMGEGPITAYIGFDCTAKSLHVGSLVQIMMLRWLQKTGNKPLVLLGDATTRIGDPTGRDESRKMLSDQDIEDNLTGIQGIFQQFLDFGDDTADAKFVRNLDWMGDVKYLDLLREVGTDFTINRMLTFDSVKLRLDREQPMTFLEFNYMILQAYDFMKLKQNEDCVLQLGGSDQWGNIVNGIELTRRKLGSQVFGVTTPLITTADGGKMGKTAGGAIWLNEAMLSNYDYWQFWRNTQDADVGKFLRLFTDLPLDEIARLETLEGQEINEAKKILANAATSMCRGADAAVQAEKTAHETFVRGGAGADLPTVEIEAGRLEAGMGVLDIFLEAGLGSSKGEVRRLVKQGGAKVNDQKVAGEDVVIGADSVVDGQIKLSAGKKRHALVKPV